MAKGRSEDNETEKRKSASPKLRLRNQRKEIRQLVLEAVCVDILEKRQVEVVPKGAFAPLLGEPEGDARAGLIRRLGGATN